MDDYEALSELTAAARLPIGSDELHIFGWPKLRMMIRRRCYDVCRVHRGRRPDLRVIDECRAWGVAYTPPTWNTGIGFTVELHLMAVGGPRRPPRVPPLPSRLDSGTARRTADGALHPQRWNPSPAHRRGARIRH